MGKYDDKTIDKIIDMYLKEEKSGQAIAKELGIPRSTVYFYIKKNIGYDNLDFTKRNFRSKDFGICLDNHNVVQSYSKPHTPTDNAVVEAFFKSLKQEELYRRVYRSEREFKESIAEYMRFYNEDRPHKTLHYKTPIQFEAGYYNGGKPAKDKR